MLALQEKKVVIRQKLENDTVVGWGLFNILADQQEGMFAAGA